jgi:site-specific DNA-cytosine methylase
MNELHLFAGAGGGILAGQMLGHRCVCAVEWEPYAQAVLVARQNDGSLPPFPIWDDVQTFDGRPWRGIVDIVAGGFPCQDISVAGKGAGINGARSGMWGHMARIVGEVRPRHVFVENSPALITRGLGRVLSDLAALGYDTRWTVLGAADVGAPHQRDRFWLLATDTKRERPAAGTQGEARGALHHQDGDGAPDQCGRHQLESRPGCKCHAVAHTNGMRELQPQGCQRHQRGRACDCGCEMAYADSFTTRGLPQRACKEYAGACQCCEVGDSHCSRLKEQRGGITNGSQLTPFECPSWWQSEPDLGRGLDGLAEKLDANPTADIGGE